MNTTGNTVAGVWYIFVTAIVVLSAMGAGLGTVQGQTPDDALYYGDAVSESGDDLPSGTVIRAVVTGDGSNRTVDEITIETAGEYGGPGYSDDVLEVPGNIDAEVSFVAETGYGNFTAQETVQNPPSGQQQLNLTFPVGSAEPRPYFEVSSLQPTDGSVVKGDTVEVNATVENIGSAQGTQTMSLAVDGQSTQTTEVTLGPGSQETISFSLDTASLGPGDYTHSIASNDDSQSGTLTVEASRQTFEVNELSPTDLTVIKGDRINASATVTNTGNTEGTQTITVEAGGTTLTSRDVTLAAGGEQTVDFTDVSTDTLAPGTYTHGVFSANGSATGTLTVEADRTEFTVSELTPAGRTLTVGTEFTVSATITNEGTVEGTQTVGFQIDGQRYEFKDVTLAPNDQQTLSFTPVNTSELGPGSYTYEVASKNDSQTGTVVVEGDSPAFTVSDRSQSASTVTVGTTVDVSATVTNVGGETGSQRAVLAVDGSVTDSEDLSLAPDESARTAFAIDTNDLGPGTYTYSISTENDSEGGSLTVERDDGDTNESDNETENDETDIDTPTPSFVISEFRPANPVVTQGDPLNVTATVENDGGREGTQRVRLLVDGGAVTEESVTLSTGESATLPLSAETESLAVGDHVIGLATDDDRRAGTLRVQAATTSTPTPQQSTATPTPQPPTATPTPPETVPTETTQSPTGTTQTTTEESNDDDEGGGLLPSGLLGTVFLWVGVPLLVVYGILKAMAIYLGY